jgi:capsid protein
MSPLGLSDYQADPWRFNQCYWQPPGWDWVDPLKDANAAIELRKNNMLTLKDYYSSGGQNYKAELRQIAKEKAYLAELETEYDVDMSTADQTAAKAQEAAASGADAGADGQGNAQDEPAAQGAGK